MKISRELKTGVVSVVIIAAFIWGYNYMKGQNLFENTSRTYFAEYNDIKGLNTASSVTINGYQVGKVVSIEFNENPEKRGGFSCCVWCHVLCHVKAQKIPGSCGGKLSRKHAG